MGPWSTAALAAGNAIGKAVSAPPIVNPPSPNYNRVSVGAPVFTTRPTAASNTANAIGQLPTIAIVGAAALVAVLVLK